MNLPKSFDWINHLKKYDGNPILRPQGEYAADCIFNPAAIAKDGKVYMLCRCINFADKLEGRNNWSKSSLVWATSDNGTDFTLDTEPFLCADDEYAGGFEDPRLVYIKDADCYLLTYTGVRTGRDTVGMLAISKDLKNWEFVGEAFPYRAIAITDVKINGRYYAYYGNSCINYSWSEDLVHWHAEKEPVLSQRPDYFDECLCEAVAAPIVNDDGILLLYNGATDGKYRKEIPQQLKYASFRGSVKDHVYSIGWALFDRNDPTKLIARSEEPILYPEYPYECYGIAEYTTFGQATVHFNGKWHLYYGCSDTRIAVAIEE